MTPTAKKCVLAFRKIDNYSTAYVARKSGLSESTIRRLKKCDVNDRYNPQFKTIEFALAAVGKRLEIV